MFLPFLKTIHLKHFGLCDGALQPLKYSKVRIHKSRNDTIESYLSFCGEKYNDLELPKDEDIYNQLLDAGKRVHWGYAVCICLP